ncbi:MAG: hypothetical protein PF488_04770 [Patescibacteria group bacterium]|jgi:hypothetical protein|nr:hypothetical protein [Patescibacteria group bacterium]
MPKNKIKTLRNKADKTFQELGRKMYDKCLVCGKPVSCLHHYYTKGSSTPLRYDIDNGIALCQGCHFLLHNGNPDIQNKINEVKGEEWLKELNWKRHNIQVRTNVQFYQDNIDRLQKLIDKI